MKHLKIGEAAARLGVKPHVLRQWEEEFVSLRPKKTRGSHRMYGPRELEVAKLIQQLLNTEGYSLSGAKKQLPKRLREQRGESDPPPPESAPDVELRALRASLSNLLEVVQQHPRRRPLDIEAFEPA